jgi:hypothetical protein
MEDLREIVVGRVPSRLDLPDQTKNLLRFVVEIHQKVFDPAHSEHVSGEQGLIRHQSVQTAGIGHLLFDHAVIERIHRADMAFLLQPEGKE